MRVNTTDSQSGNAPSPSRVAELPLSDGVQIELRAHNALDSRQARWFLLSVAIGPACAGVYWLIQGFWPVLPFAGLEYAALYLALRHSLRRGKRRQSIRISADEVLITAQSAHEEVKTRFPRHWTRVRLRAPQAARYPSRLWLESHGRRCEVGVFLTEEERRMLAARLKQLVGDMNDSPKLELKWP